MKNLLIYINPERRFDPESGLMAKVQVDNSLRLGWRKEDILMVTNFPYKHNGVRTEVVPDKLYCDYHAQMSKINTLLHLFSVGAIGEGMWWFHDFDAFQNDVLGEVDLGEADAGFTDYGYKIKWNTGSFFFKKEAEDLFESICRVAHQFRTNEEVALGYLTDGGVDDGSGRCKKLNVTYNLPGNRDALRNLATLRDLVAEVGLPAKVLHFHPLRRKGAYYRMMLGDNPLNWKLMTDGLLEVFNAHRRED